MIKITAAILFVIASSVSLHPQGLIFFREDIVFEIRDDTFFVSGNYYFSNPGDALVSRVLSYPFPVDSSLGQVTQINGKNLNSSSQANIILSFNKNGAAFKVQVGNMDTAIIRIEYEQPLYGNKAEYILTTTSKWGRPFDLADYTLRIPSEIYMVDSLSFQPDTCFESPKESIYVWSKRNFIPVKNFIVFFRKKAF